jgi:hypothetical protein
MDSPKVLPLSDLSERHRGLTPAIAESYLEATRVCLDRHHHSPATFTITTEEVTDTLVIWHSTDQRCREAWANEIDTTESGAYACALAAGELVLGLVAIRRAETGTGADYYVAPPGASREDLEEYFRFEVSGVNDGDAAAVRSRLNQKVKQTLAGKSNLPALAGVVGFGQKMILLKAVEAGQ